MGIVNIAVECDAEHRASIYALVSSIIINKNVGSRYCIYMLTGDSDKELWNKLVSVTDENVEIKVHDKAFSEIRGIGKVILFKWNILVMGDLSEFFEMNLDGKAFAAAENLPEIEYNIPETTEAYNSSVLLVDTSKSQNTNDYKDISIFYNYGYEEFVRNKDKISVEKLGVAEKDYAKVRDWALILRIDKSMPAEKYFDSPLSQIWMKYYKLSPIGSEPLQRTAYIETEGEMGIREEDTVPVLLSVEDSNVVYAVALISSLEENLDKARKLDVRLIYKQLSKKHKKILTDMSTGRMNITLHNIQQYVSKQQRSCKELMASLIFSDYDKAVCLDTNMIFEDDICKIYDLNMSEYLIRARQTKNMVMSQKNDEAAKEDIYFANVSGIDTGVVLVNIKSWICNNVNEQIQSLLNSNEYKKYSEQDILNIVTIKHRAYITEQFKICEHNQQEERYNELAEAYILKNSYGGELMEEKKFYETREDENVKEILEKIQKLEDSNKKLREKNKELEASNKTLRKKDKELRAQNKVLNKERDRFLYEILEIRKSVTYKIGRAITLIPRKLRGNK